MINYGYFRHRFDASQDPKLQALIDDMGIIALGYYYSLLELYGHHYSSNNNGLEVVIHRRVIANTWRKRVDSCDLVLTKLQLSDLLVYTKHENTYTIAIPNFLKYYGSYKKKKVENALIKEKKIKEKKIPPLSPKTGGDDGVPLTLFDEVIQLWNTTLANKENFKHVRGLRHDTKQKFFELIKLNPELKKTKNWKECFDIIANTPLLSGNTESRFVCTLPWLIDTQKIVDVLNGQFGANYKVDIESLLSDSEA